MYEITKQKLNPAQRDKRKLIRLSVAAGALLLFFVVLLALRLNETFSEFMARTVNRWYNKVFGTASSVFSFISLYEVFLYAIITAAVCLIIWTVWLFKRRETLKAFSSLLVMLIIALSVMGIYNFTAGFAYNRAEIPVPLGKATVNLKEAREFADGYIAELARLSDKFDYDGDTGYVIMPYSYSELNAVLKKEYARLDDDYFSAYTPAVKKIQSGLIMTNMGLSGVAFSPFGEANVNSLTPTRSLPVTMCHEIAHIKGVMREDDANLLAYYICLTAENDFVRYCGLSYTLSIVMNAVHTGNGSDKEYAALYNSIPKKVLAERDAVADFWNSNNLASDIMDWFNDLYLKFNGTGGISDYPDPGAVNPDPTPPVPKAPEDIIINLSRYQRMIFNLALG